MTRSSSEAFVGARDAIGGRRRPGPASMGRSRLGRRPSRPLVPATAVELGADIGAFFAYDANLLSAAAAAGLETESPKNRLSASSDP